MAGLFSLGVKTDGLDAVAHELRAVGAELVSMRSTMKRIADATADVAPRYMPRRSGRLRASVKAEATPGRATVTIGGPTAPYARVIDLGWPSRNIRPAKFSSRTDHVMDVRAVLLLDQGIDRLLKEHGE